MPFDGTNGIIESSGLTNDMGRPASNVSNTIH